MDEQLKRRLMGATIIVTLSVIFVPMLFEDKSEGPAGGVKQEVPALPEAIEQHAIELPKSAADAAAEENTPGRDNKKEAETGYRVIPLEDAPPAKPAKVEPPPTRQATAPTEEAEVPVEEEGTAEAEAEPPPPAKPGVNKGVAKDAHKSALTAKGASTSPRKAKPGVETARPAPAKKPVQDAVEPEESPEMVGEEPEFAPEEAPPVKAPEPPAKKVNKAKPPVVAQAKPVAPKPALVPPSAKATETAPPAKVAPVKPVVSPKPVPPVAAINPPPPAVKPQEPKRAATPPEVTPPASWSVQAGSFTAETNARSLVDKLRKAGLSANMQVSQGQSGPVFRVAVGAGASRAQAEQIQKQIESAVGIRGIIQSHR
ncbi:SPOR domain-containing protein [Methylomagnum sp.]